MVYFEPHFMYTLEYVYCYCYVECCVDSVYTIVYKPDTGL